MTIQLLKKNNGIDGEIEEYKKNLRKHRLIIFARWVGVFAVLFIGILGIRYYVNHKVYTEYRVVASFDRSDTMNTQ